MPKLKTNRGAAKRFKVTGSGRLKRRHAYMNHKLTHKKRKVKRRLRKSAIVASGDTKRLKAMLAAGL